MVKTKKGFSLVELIVAIAVVGITTTLAVLFCVSTANTVKKENARNDSLYEVKDVRDYIFNWFERFDTTEYELYDVTDASVTFRNVSTSVDYTLSYSDGTISANTTDDDYTYEINDVDGVSFERKDNALKVIVEYYDCQTAFVIYKKTN